MDWKMSLAGATVQLSIGAVTTRARKRSQSKLSTLGQFRANQKNVCYKEKLMLSKSWTIPMFLNVTISSAQPTIATSSLSFATKEISSIYLKSDKNFQKLKLFLLFVKFLWDSSTFRKTGFFIVTSNLPTFSSEIKQSRSQISDLPNELVPILNKVSMLVHLSIWVQKLCNQIYTQLKTIFGQLVLFSTRCFMGKLHGHAQVRDNSFKKLTKIAYLSWKVYLMIWKIS